MRGRWWLILLLIATPLRAQFSSTVTEINPNQATFDPNDADSASGGRVNQLGRAANGTTFFAASEWGGIFRSTDTGQTWTHLPGHVPHVTWDVEVDPTNANTVYATSFYDGRVNSIAGINISRDGGTTWAKPASATPPVGFCAAARRDEPYAYGISINPANNQNVVVGTNCGVAISNDAGNTWRFFDPTPNDGGATDVFDVVVHDGGIIDTCGADAHRRSIDGGTTWTTAAMAPLPAGQCSITVSPDEANVLIAVVGTTLFESDNGGQSWPVTFTNPELRPQGRIPFVTVNQRTGNAFDLWYGDVSLFRASCTTPAGGGAGRRCPANAWSARFTRLRGGHDDVGDLAFATGAANDACPVLFASDGGVYFNTLNASPGCQTPSWEQPNVTPHALWLMGMGGASEPGQTNEDLYFGAQDNGPFAATNAPAAAPTWNSRACCDSFDIAGDTTRVLFTNCCFTPAPGNRLFTGGVGMTAIAQVTNLPNGSLPPFRYPDVVSRFAASRYGVVTSNGIFFTNNITLNPIVWTQLGAATSPANPQAIQTAVSGGTTTFFVQTGVVDGRNHANDVPPTFDRLFRFAGTGAGNWQQVNRPGGAGAFGIVAVDPNNPNRIFASHLRAGNPPQMVLTNDGGTTWTVLAALDALMTGGGVFRYENQRGFAHTDNTAAAQQIGYPQPTLVAFDPEEANVLVAGGADSGVFVSIDSGANWRLVTDPINPGTSGRAHIPRPRFAYFDHEQPAFSTLFRRRVDVYIGSQGRGVWRVRLGIPFAIADSFCAQNPDVCRGPVMASGSLSIDCTGVRQPKGSPVDCVSIDPIPENCLLKFDCPGCPSSGLCPPFFRFVMEGMDPEIWDVGVIDDKGLPVDYDVSQTEKNVIVSFRPEKERFREGAIGDYNLVFVRRAGAKGDKYTFGMRLETGDAPR